MVGIIRLLQHSRRHSAETWLVTETDEQTFVYERTKTLHLEDAIITNGAYGQTSTQKTGEDCQE